MSANQAPPFEDVNLFARDAALGEALRREGAGWAEAEVHAFGALAGRRETIAWGRQANASPPQLRTHDRTGERIDEVELHPAWHALLGLGVEHGLHASPWRAALAARGERPWRRVASAVGPDARSRDAGDAGTSSRSGDAADGPTPPQHGGAEFHHGLLSSAGAHVARAARFMLLAQVEAGVGCPLSMTYAAVAALAADPVLADEWVPRLTSTAYDPRPVPAREKTGALCGMAMTERQGGSDVRANTTRAEPRGAGAYELSGHKWFCSAPMCDLFLVLAQAEGGLTCFALPRFTPDGARNHFHLQRLKDKLGNRSNASSEVELCGAWARRLGPEGRGVPTILEMVNHTRLDCALGSAAAMRQAVERAVHHARHRRAFGRLLIDQPLMANVLADLAIESEAATVAVLRLARAYDGDGDLDFRRLATAVLKYWVCKRAMPVAAEALECLGGNGYVEEWDLARLYREVPLNSIWEGSGNVQCLDVLRAIRREPASLAALLAEIEMAAGTDRRLDAHVARLRRALEADTRSEGAEEAEGAARRLVEGLATALCGSLLVRHAPAAVADGWCAGRLAEHGFTFGTLPPGTDHAAILERAAPA